MRLLGITDLHGDHTALERILSAAGQVDVILLGGDITHFGTPNTAESVVRRLQRACPQVLAVAGNCDSAEIDRRLTDLGVSLFRRAVEYQGVGFYGLSAMPPWQGRMYELPEEELERAWRAGRAQLARPAHAGPGWPGPPDEAGAPSGSARPVREVVLSHTPPQHTQLDRTRRGEHVGSSSVRRLIDQVQPTLVVCGHIHESRGVEPLGSTTVVNCGHARVGEYALIELDEALRVELRSAT